MKKNKTFSKKGALIGFVISLILLTLCYVTYKLTVLQTILDIQYSTSFKIAVFVYGWAYMLFTFLATKINISISSPLLFFIISSTTYTLLGGYIGTLISKKTRRKKHTKN